MSCITIPKITIPGEQVDLYKWAVIACDQYTSQLEYWKEVEKIVGDAPSTLKMIIPEVYLGQADEQHRVESICQTMANYLRDGTLRELPEGFILTERYTGGCAPRRGLVAAIDLECYEYAEGKRSLIRPTEQTVVERIPPRLQVRKNAPVELPHIMMLIDDPGRTVIEPLFEHLDELTMVYDTDLMLRGGHIRGWFLPAGKLTEDVIRHMDALMDRQMFREKYHLNAEYPLLNCIVGDGNHSLATAKANWELVKQGLTEAECRDHPARFCLCELVNIHDESLTIEPIHRVIFHIAQEELMQAALAFYSAHGCECRFLQDGNSQEPDTHLIPYCSEKSNGVMEIRRPEWGIPVRTLQMFLDDYLLKHPEAGIDYIHGRDVVVKLGKQPGNMGFILPAIQKKDIFQGVIIDGVLPRKTFSMGEAHEKRYYLETKQIVPVSSKE